MSKRKYAFSWSLLGDIKLGRPNLGGMASLEVYRLMQFSLSLRPKIHVFLPLIFQNNYSKNDNAPIII